MVDPRVIVNGKPGRDLESPYQTIGFVPNLASVTQQKAPTSQLYERSPIDLHVSMSLSTIKMQALMDQLHPAIAGV